MSPISHPQLTIYVYEHDGDHHLKLCHPAHISNQVYSRGRSRLPNPRPFEDPGSGQEPSAGQLRWHLRRAHLRSKLFEPAGCHGCVPAGGPGQPGQVIVIMRMMWVRIKMMIRIIISWDYCQPRQDRAGPLLQLVHCHPAREPRPEHGAGDQQHFLTFFII